MSKIKIYLLILAVAIVAVALGYMMHIKPIQSLCAASLTYMKNPVLPVTAAVCAFLFYGVKNYWLIIIGCHRHRRCYAVCYRGPRHDNLFIYQQGFGFPGRCVFDEPGKTNF